MIAFEKSAEANEAGSNEWHAGKHLETCAQLAKDVGTPADVMAYAERSCAAYCTAGSSFPHPPTSRALFTQNSVYAVAP